jgi:hypothetical protein
MPATALTVTQLSHKSSVNITLADTPGVDADVTNGNSVTNGGSTFVVASNTAGSSATVTVALTALPDGQAVTPVSHTIAAGKVRLIPIGPPTYYGSVTTITASATTVKLAAYAMPN